jgi:hypothetical protein
MQITRRTALTALPAAITLSTLPALAKDPHGAWWAEWERLKAESVRLGGLSEHALRTFERGCGYLDNIAETPATTPEGLLVQVRLQEHYNKLDRDGTPEEMLMRSMRIYLESVVAS